MFHLKNRRTFTLFTNSLIEEGLILSKELDYKGSIAAFLSLSARVFLLQGDIAKARSLLEKSLISFKEGGYRQDIAESLCVLAGLVASQGDLVAAHALYEESLALAKGANDNGLIASNMEGLAAVVATQGEPTWAACLWGAAEALRETMGTPIYPVQRADYERSVAAARTQLGEQSFAIAWAEGRTMTPEQALAKAE